MIMVLTKEPGLIDPQFGDSRDVGAMRLEEWYLQLDVVGKARAEGWACGCPIVEELIADRGAGAMLERYSEVNTMHEALMTAVRDQNQHLHHYLAQTTTRYPEEIPQKFEPDSVPDDYAETMPVIGSLVGYALPRIAIEIMNVQDSDNPAIGSIEELVENLKQAIIDSNNPYEFLARVSTKACELGVAPERIFHHVFIEGWIEEHNATSMMALAADAFRMYAPGLFEKYVRLSPEEWRDQELHMDFTSVINYRSTSKERIDLTTHEITNGRGLVELRGRGGHIIQGWLENPQTQGAVQVLYSDDDLTIGKLTATHMMSPVGPSDGVGGQHGLPRWADYRIFKPDENPNNGLYCQAKRNDVREPTILRAVELPEPSKLVITNVLQSNRHERAVDLDEQSKQRASMGEHVYLACRESEIGQIVIDGLYIQDILSDEIVAGILEGKPYLWEREKQVDPIEINFFDGRKVQLGAEAKLSHSETPDDATSLDETIKYLIWHRPGTDSICIEPVVGYRQDNDGPHSDILLEKGDRLELKITIELISS